MLILPLNNAHDRKGFDCGDIDLNAWLRDIAKQHQGKRISSTFVATNNQASAEIVGYYAISSTELVSSDLPIELKKRLPGRVPAFRLGRLAISLQHQRKGLGEFLLFDAIDRTTRVADEIGGVGLVVDAKSSAIDFYRNYGFVEMPDRPQNLILRFS